MHDIHSNHNHRSDKLSKPHFVSSNSNSNGNGYCRTTGCLNGIGKKRAALGHTVCKVCGEAASATERSTWCVMQEYGKGGYQFVTANAARTALKQTNQKQVRV